MLQTCRTHLISIRFDSIQFNELWLCCLFPFNFTQMSGFHSVLLMKTPSFDRWLTSRHSIAFQWSHSFWFDDQFHIHYIKSTSIGWIGKFTFNFQKMNYQAPLSLHFSNYYFVSNEVWQNCWFSTFLFRANSEIDSISFHLISCKTNVSPKSLNFYCYFRGWKLIPIGNLSCVSAHICWKSFSFFSIFSSNSNPIWNRWRV